MKNPSATELWNAFTGEFPEYLGRQEPPAGHFGASEEVADACVRLVLQGRKRSTSHSLLGLQHRGEPLPKIGDLNIVTDWAGKAHCIVRTTKVRLKPFFSISREDSLLEGEGDGSLDYWRRVHWDFYTEELEAFGKKPAESMIVVCEEFEKIYERS
jgi:uncharacterized protein YhfF